jgi:ATP-grasp domain, R2K clade family 3
MRILYPSDPLMPAQAEDFYEEERATARGAGLATALFSLEDFRLGRFKVRPALEAGDVVLYRGWMLRLGEYERLSDAVANAGARMLTSAAQYRLTHHLPAWYEHLKEFTPETRFFSDPRDAVQNVRDEPQTAYFVKDWVKSLSTGRGSIAESPEDIAEIADQLAHYRGGLEGGLCLRAVEHYIPESEERYFVADGQVFARAGSVPQVAEIAAARISSSFFTVDVARREDDELRIVELGDGQVSDLKEWTLEAFLPVLRRLAGMRRDFL